MWISAWAVLVRLSQAHKVGWAAFLLMHSVIFAWCRIVNLPKGKRSTCAYVVHANWSTWSNCAWHVLLFAQPTPPSSDLPVAGVLQRPFKQWENRNVNRETVAYRSCLLACLLARFSFSVRTATAKAGRLRFDGLNLTLSANATCETHDPSLWDIAGWRDGGDRWKMMVEEVWRRWWVQWIDLWSPEGVPKTGPVRDWYIDFKHVCDLQRSLEGPFAGLCFFGIAQGSTPRELLKWRTWWAQGVRPTPTLAKIKTNTNPQLRDECPKWRQVCQFIREAQALPSSSSSFATLGGVVPSAYRPLFHQIGACVNIRPQSGETPCMSRGEDSGILFPTKMRPSRHKCTLIFTRSDPELCLVFGLHSSHVVMCVPIHQRPMDWILLDKVMKKTPVDLQKRFPIYPANSKYLAADCCGLAITRDRDKVEITPVD